MLLESGYTSEGSLIHQPITERGVVDGLVIRRGPSMWTHFVALVALVALAASTVACGSTTPPPQTPEPEPHHHELHLPPVGPSVHVTFDGKIADVTLSAIPHQGSSLPLMEIWKRGFPAEDPTALHFDLVGSDGFHPGARPKCARLLTGAEVGEAHMDIVTHDVSFNEKLDLPGCYRVKAVVSVDATR
jgi:hypothetical protein